MFHDSKHDINIMIKWKKPPNIDNKLIITR